MRLTFARRATRWLLLTNGGIPTTSLIWVAPTWTTSGGSAFNVPTQGSTVVANGGFDADTDWVKGTGWTITGGAGVKASGAISQIHQANTLTIDSWYSAIWTLTHTASTFGAIFGTSAQRGIDRSSTGTFTDTQRAITGTQAGIRALSTSSAGSIDDVSFRLLALSSLIASVDTGLTALRVSADVGAMQASTQVGVVANLDSATSPANFVMAYHDSTATIKLVKCVAGTYTELISTASTFVPGARIEILRPSGNTYQLWYNGAQVGSNQTISDAGIISNTRYGMFSTYSANTISAFLLNNQSVPFFF